MSAKTINDRLRERAAASKSVFDQVRKLDAPYNETYRVGRDDLEPLLRAAEGVGATDARVLDWYANGPACADRPTMLAAYHPLVHKREWEQIYDTAYALAVELKRWVYLTVGEDRWARILLGEDPAIEKPVFDPQRDHKGRYQNDQFLTCFAPNGDEHFIGAS